MVHDHPKPQTKSDIEYERTRFTRGVLRDSANYLEDKYGFDFWSAGVDFWLDSKHNSLALNPGELQPAAPEGQIAEALSTKSRPTIALVIDSENWAFANIAKQIVKQLSATYDFKIIATEIVDNINQVLMMTEDCDITHFFWRESINLVNFPSFGFYAESLGSSTDEFKRRFVDSRIITSAVYDHLFLSDEEIAARVPLFNQILSGYTVSSQRLFDIYGNISGYPPPSQLAEDGVDLMLFKPQNTHRFNELENRPMVIGWAGNSKWSAEREDFKGFHSILQPAIEQLQKEGLNIKTCYADRQNVFIPHDEMPDYYAQIDVYVCPSKIEGTPNPILESMACGVPVVTTDVGVVPQLLGPLQKQCIVEDRTVEGFTDMLRSLYQRRAVLLPELSLENLESIQSWSWSIKVGNFAKFFDDVLQKAAAKRLIGPRG